MVSEISKQAMSGDFDPNGVPNIFALVPNLSYVE